MKIFVISHACVTPENREIYRRLVHKGAQVDIVMPLAEEYGKKEFPEDQTDLNIYHRKQTGFGSRFHTYKGLRNLLDQREPDIVLLDLEPDSLLAWQLGRWCLEKKKKLIIQTCENLSPERTVCLKGFLMRKAQLFARRCFLKKALKATSYLFPISDDGADLLKSMGFASKNIIKIPLGVNVQHFKPDSRQREELRSAFNVDGQSRIIAYFGRIVEAKGIDILINSLGLLLNDKSWKFLIDMPKTAQSSYQEKIQTLIKKNQIEDRVLYFEALHSEMPKFYNATDIVVVPSRDTPQFVEQYGRVVAEALACGKTLIISDSGALSEVAGGCAIIAKSENITDLSTKLGEALQIPKVEIAENSERNIRRAQKAISVEQQLDKIWPIFAEN
ncbi:MAG: glycosyltransferase family 4 protein [Chthoniobacterales bacterium]